MVIPISVKDNGAANPFTDTYVGILEPQPPPVVALGVGQTLKDSNHPGNRLFILLPSGKRFRSMMAKTVLALLIQILGNILF